MYYLMEEGEIVTLGITFRQSGQPPQTNQTQDQFSHNYMQSSNFKLG